MRCPGCGVPVCKYGDECHFGDRCRYCHCTSEKLRENLERGVAKEKLSKDEGYLKYRLIDLSKWYQQHSPRDFAKRRELAEELLEISKRRDDFRSQSINLQTLIELYEELLPQETQEIWNLLERQLEVNQQWKNPRGQSMVLQRMINWVEANQGADGDRLWNLLERKSKIETDSSNDLGISMVLSRKISWVEHYDPDNKDLLWRLIQEQYEQNTRMGHAEGRGWSLQKMIDWYETHGADDPEGLWSVLERKLAQEVEDKNLRGQAMIHQRMINWVETNEPQNTQRLWDLLTSQLDLEVQASNSAGQGMTLRRMWNLDDTNGLSQNQIDFIKTALELPDFDDFEGLFSFFSLRSCLDMPVLDYPSTMKISTPRDEALWNIMNTAYAPSSFTERWFVHRFNDNWWHDSLHRIPEKFENFDSLLILDLPNVHQGFRRKDENLDVLFEFIREQQQPMIAHLTLRYVLEEWSLIERLLGESDNLTMAFPILHGHMSEDSNMLMLAMMFENARIVTCDKMRDEQRNYPELVDAGVFEKVFPWRLQDGRFSIDE